MARSLEPIFDKLAEAQSAFLRTADAIPSTHWTRKPSPKEWSAAEVVAHLVAVERSIVGGADRVTQKAPKPTALLKRAHLPLWLVKVRLVRLKSPIPSNPAMIADKEEMLGELRAARERSLAFLEETRNRDLSCYCWRHAFLGTLNLYEWFEMIAAHQVRHTKQMRALSARLPKVVGISQN